MNARHRSLVAREIYPIRRRGRGTTTFLRGCAGHRPHNAPVNRLRRLPAACCRARRRRAQKSRKSNRGHLRGDLVVASRASAVEGLRTESGVLRAGSDRSDMVPPFSHAATMCVASSAGSPRAASLMVFAIIHSTALMWFSAMLFSSLLNTMHPGPARDRRHT